MDLARLPLPLPSPEAALCPLCRTTAAGAAEGHAGCPLCYDVFAATMRALLGGKPTPQGQA